MKKELGLAPLAIGGWLYLVGIRIFLGILTNGNLIVTSLNLQLKTPFEIIRVLILLILVYALVVLTLFAKKHKAFPAAYIILESLFILLNVFSFFIYYSPISIAASTFHFLSIAIPIPIGILWILYMVLSKRVKKTFVCGWKSADRLLVDKANSIVSGSQP